MTKTWRFLTAYAISNIIYSCAPATPSTIRVGGGDSPTPIIAVQLNDAWNQEFPSEAVEILDARYFTPPSVVQVVNGTYAGNNPGQYLHARILVNNEQCEYQATSITATQLELQFCSGGIVANTLLPAGSFIELNNFDAPGLLLEVHFNLVR